MTWGWGGLGGSGHSAGTHSLAHHCLGILIGVGLEEERKRERERASEHNRVWKQRITPFSIRGIPSISFGLFFPSAYSISPPLPLPSPPPQDVPDSHPSFHLLYTLPFTLHLRLCPVLGQVPDPKTAAAVEAADNPGGPWSCI